MQDLPPRKRGWLWDTQLVPLVLLTFTALVVLGTTVTVLKLRTDAVQFHAEVVALQARTFESQLTQSLHVIELLLGQPLDSAGKSDDVTGLNQQLQAEAARLPAVRSLSVLSANGRIEASSNVANVGRVVRMEDYLPQGVGERTAGNGLQVGLPWGGRDFADGRVVAPPQSLSATQASFVPVARQAVVRGRLVTVVANLNPDYFINTYTRNLHADVGGSVDVMRYDGTLLFSTNEQLRPGQQVNSPLATNPELEMGSFESDDGDAGPALAAFRASRAYPLVVVARVSRERALREWGRERRLILSVVAVSLTAVLSLALFVYRRQARLLKERSRAEADKRRQMATVLNSLSANLVLLDDKADIVMANSGWMRLLSTRQVAGMGVRGNGNFLELCRRFCGAPAPILEELAKGLQAVLRHQQEHYATEIESRWEGAVQWFHAEVRRLDEPGMAGVIVILQDITDRIEAEAQLRLAASVFTHAREGIMITDANGHIVDVNETFSRITGYARDEVVGQSPRILKSGRHSAQEYEAMWRSLRDQGYWSGEIWNRRKDGEVYAEMQSISAVFDPSQSLTHYVSLFTDITPQKQHQAELESIAHFDALTHLPNRVLFADRLDQALLQCERRKGLLAVVYLDLDGFKAVNDSHGHAVGDALLVQLAQRMRFAVREGDSIARLGGDEFVAVLVDLESEQACLPVLERLLTAASEPVQLAANGQAVVLKVSASIGAALYPQHGRTGNDLMRVADAAMYRAKLQGKNRYCIYAEATDRPSPDHRGGTRLE